MVHNSCCGKCTELTYHCKSRPNYWASWLHSWRLTSVKTSYENCLQSVILCSGRWLILEVFGVHVLQSCSQLNKVLPAGSKRNNKDDHSKLWVSTGVIIIPTLSWTQDAFFWDHSSYSYFGIGITEYTEYQFPIKQIARYSENRIADVIRRDRRRREIFPPKYYSVHFCYREQNERHSIPFIPE